MKAKVALQYYRSIKGWLTYFNITDRYWQSKQLLMMFIIIDVNKGGLVRRWKQSGKQIRRLFILLYNPEERNQHEGVYSKRRICKVPIGADADSDNKA